VEFDEEMMKVVLTDGRILSVPLLWFPVLREAMPEQRARYEIGGGGISLHWPALDEDLSIANLMAGADWQSTECLIAVGSIFDVIMASCQPRNTLSD